MNGVPSSAMPRMVGRMISRSARAWMSGVMTGAGEYAPMPPVLGPWSPLSRRLWSWLVASASTLRPSAITMKLASSPVRKASTTTRAVSLPSLLPPVKSSPRNWSTAAWASATVWATTTPLPAARPSAFTTMGAP